MSEIGKLTLISDIPNPEIIPFGSGKGIIEPLGFKWSDPNSDRCFTRLKFSIDSGNAIKITNTVVIIDNKKKRRHNLLKKLRKQNAKRN